MCDMCDFDENLEKKKKKKKKKKTPTEFWRYEKSTMGKFFFLKFSAKCTELIFDLIKM